METDNQPESRADIACGSLQEYARHPAIVSSLNKAANHDGHEYRNCDVGDEK